MSTMTRISPKPPRAARAEAAVWIVRLHGEERTPELEAGLREWLTADPENARQFEHITEVWELSGAVTAEGLPRMRSWKPAIPKSRWMVAATAVTMCAIAVFAAWWRWADSAYVTAHGEQRLVYLDDGSRVYLNSDSRLRVEFERDERRVRLERGEGFFEVARDPRRLFVVEAGDRQVTALGTAFLVRYELARTAITLVEGKVTVAGEKQRPGHVDASGQVAGSGEPRVFTLTPGERLTLARLAPPKVDAPRLEAVTAWRRGEVLLESTELSEAVAEMNRYDKRQLVIDDVDLTRVRVSGIYRTGDSEGFAHAVAELHGLEVVDTSDEIHLRRSATGTHPSR